ncbi:MAG: GHKL domain-containing protein, partial [Verrucomicrobiae bacterium]|nr:GHKL domain-containing protein [Verrucomicrobiae bacterium]
KLRRRARLDSIATLADGVAHEINNPVTGIANYAQLICDSAPADSELQEFAGEISRESARISSIVDRLYTFARRGPTAKGAVLRPENVLWRVVAGIRPAVARHRIALLLDIPGNLPSVRCSDKEMESVLVNLLGNSLDALNQRHPGGGPDKRLGLIARCVEREGDPWLRLTVEDHGTGIVPLVAERMYEPFFTTKRKNQAVGLGLSTCLSIVEGHQGELRMTTRPGEFTRFVVELPGIASAGGADEPVRDDGV